MATKQYIAAGGVVIDDGRMLLLDRPLRREVRLPKGHIDPGETAAGAALRETAEESGYADLEITGDLGRQVVSFNFQGDDFVRTEHYFLMRLHSDAQTSPQPKRRGAQFMPIWLPWRKQCNGSPSRPNSSLHSAQSTSMRAAQIQQQRQA